MARGVHTIGVVVATNDTFERLRHEMVERQLRRRGIRDERVLAAMDEVPRHVFVPAERTDAAYMDGPLMIGYGQTISQPLMVAEMMQALELTGDEQVLDIGAGSGYQTAVLSRLARHVYAIEIVPALAERAHAVLERLGYDNVTIHEGDGSLGWKQHAPYDAIVVAAGAPDIPPPLVEQLADGGRLVLPVGHRFGQALVRVRKIDGSTRIERLGGCAFVPLIGEFGWR